MPTHTQRPEPDFSAGAPIEKLSEEIPEAKMGSTMPLFGTSVRVLVLSREDVLYHALSNASIISLRSQYL